MRVKSSVWTASVIFLFLSFVSWAQAEFLPDSAQPLTRDLRPSDAEGQNSGKLPAAGTKQRFSEILVAPGDDPAMRGNCIVSSGAAARHATSVAHAGGVSDSHRHLRSVRMTGRPDISRIRRSHHAPLISFRCVFDNSDSGLEAAP
jgi:hypothetical protein